jgi:hypothetical protein
MKVSLVVSCYNGKDAIEKIVEAAVMRAASYWWSVRSYLMNVIPSEAKHDNAVYEMALRNQFANERLLLS